MSAAAEKMMAEARRWLAVAVDFEGMCAVPWHADRVRRTGSRMELADTAGAIAATKIAAAIRIDERASAERLEVAA